MLLKFNGKKWSLKHPYRKRKTSSRGDGGVDLDIFLNREWGKTVEQGLMFWEKDLKYLFKVFSNEKYLMKYWSYEAFWINLRGKSNTYFRNKEEIVTRVFIVWIYFNKELRLNFLEGGAKMAEE